MPTPVQRVQVLLRPRVLEAIKELSAEEDLTLSKTCSMLVEEALYARGLFNKTKRPHTAKKELSDVTRDVVSAFLMENYLQEAVADTDESIATVTHKVEQIEDKEDLELLKKLKALKSIGLL